MAHTRDKSKRSYTDKTNSARRAKVNFTIPNEKELQTEEEKK